MRAYLRDFWQRLLGRDPATLLRREYVRRLVAETEARNPPSPARSLVTAAFNGNLARVKELLASGVPADARDGLNNTALHAAIENQRPEIVEFLLRSGANANDELTPGCTPLFHAIDIEVDAAQNWGEVAPSATITGILLRFGADPHRPGPRGESLIEFGETYGHAEAVRMLSDANSNGGR